MRISWTDLASSRAAALDGRDVVIEGWPLSLDVEDRPHYLALTDEAACCGNCLPRDPARRLEVFAAGPFEPGAVEPGRLVRLAGRLAVLENDAEGWRFQLHGAAALPEPLPHPGFTRRGVLGAAGAFGLSAWTPLAAAAAEPTAAELEAARAAIAETTTIDLHSHGGSLIGLKRIAEKAAFTPLYRPMQKGGMAVVCLTVVADSPTHHVTADKRIRPFRDPNPGELWEHFQKSMARAEALIDQQNFRVVNDIAALRAARADRPSVIVASEGADFLEGRIERVEEALRRWKLRHLQLTHYRVNELGDIQTEDRVHGGLTDFGAEVIRRCNALGIVVDVAHGTYDLVKQAAKVTKKPLVISHTSYTQKPGATSRQISEEHARIVANTGGMIGIWPPASIFGDMAALAEGIGRLADRIGVDFVGLGTDMQGLVGASTFSDYAQLPALAAALLARGFTPEDVRKILGGNYRRVFEATLAA